MSLERVWAALRNTVVRGKVKLATVTGRTLLQVAGYDQDVFNNVELLLPPGYVATPAAGADVLIFCINANRDHKVALAGDTVGQTVANLAAGEHGLRGTNGQIVMRINGHIELIGDGETLRQLVTDQMMTLFNNHVHTNGNGGGNTGVPTTPMTNAQLTGAVHAGGQS